MLKLANNLFVKWNQTAEPYVLDKDNIVFHTTYTLYRKINFSYKVIANLDIEIKNNELIILYLEVDTEFRGQGFSKLLLKTVLNLNTQVALIRVGNTKATQRYFSSLGLRESNSLYDYTINAKGLYYIVERKHLLELLKINEYTKSQLLALEPLTVYKLLLDGIVNKFPPYFWKKHSIKKTGIELFKYYIEEYLELSKQEIPKVLKAKTLREAKLHSLLTYYNGSVYTILNIAYPNEYKPWELVQVPRGFWTKETSAQAIKWLLEDKLKWTTLEIREHLSRKILHEYRLDGVLRLHHYNLFNILDNAYPNRFLKGSLEHSYTKE